MWLAGVDQGRTKESLSWATVGTEWGEGGEFMTRGSLDAVGKSYGCRISLFRSSRRIYRLSVFRLAYLLYFPRAGCIGWATPSLLYGIRGVP